MKQKKEKRALISIKIGKYGIKTSVKLQVSFDEFQVDPNKKWMNCCPNHRFTQ